MKRYMIDLDQHARATVTIFKPTGHAYKISGRDAFDAGYQYATELTAGDDSLGTFQLAATLLHDTDPSKRWGNKSVEHVVYALLVGHQGTTFDVSEKDLRAAGTYYERGETPEADEDGDATPASSPVRTAAVLMCRACCGTWRHHRAPTGDRPVPCPSCGATAEPLPEYLTAVYDVDPDLVGAYLFRGEQARPDQPLSIIVRQSCSWCHGMNVLAPGAVTFCTKCGHRADLPRINCDCPKCRPRGVKPGVLPPLETPPAGVGRGEVPPLRISGRLLRSPVFYSSCSADVARLRIDDQEDAEQWVEVQMPRWYLERLLKEIDAVRETLPLGVEDLPDPADGQ